MPRKRILIFALVCLFAAGCKCRGKAEEETEDSGKVESADVRFGDQEAEDSAGPEEDAEKKCPVDAAKLEAERRKFETELSHILAGLNVRYLMIDLIDEIAGSAAKGDFKKVEDAEKKIWNELTGMRPDISKDDLKLVDNIARRRLEGYAACMSVAEKDPKWCDAMEKAWEEGGDNCMVAYEIYVLVVSGVIKGDRDCKEVMKKSKTFKPQEAASFCEAIVNAKPEACPWEETTPQGAYCRAASSRGKMDVCGDVEEHWNEHDVKCCQSFAWRFSTLFSGQAVPGTLPEAGALQGDVKGCMNALKWGLLESYAPIFGVELPGESTVESNLYGEFTCPMMIYWSSREMLLPYQEAH